MNHDDSVLPAKKSGDQRFCALDLPLSRRDPQSSVPAGTLL